MIVIPMAGLSSRFFNAGFTQPKYMLNAHGETLFAHAINSFSHYFATESFLFIVRDVHNTVAFVEQEIARLKIKNAHIFVLDKPTRGQAETVYIGLQSRPDYQGPITIFNIDTFRPQFRYPQNIAAWDGYLEVFKGHGDNWSFALAESENSSRVIKTTEKEPISDLCSTGLYYFADSQLFNQAYQQYLAKPQTEWAKCELYIAPLYNDLITANHAIHYHLIDNNEVIFCGVPEEYEAFLEMPHE
ncbi:capsular biosynthesis protein [Photobacterium iliopiscarium]|uniref:Capsular biosynthesis protein n=1 Tax=Photobacterium iliopiscarium TaxID=56192 RepID=A0ABX5GUA0_9GAMM|nr:glycosyltransferase family 2 protein [Photobacterium iliopiscarium]KJG25512.1 capsular biosynthesis protein [Photobacterium iliopiscarium]PSW98580.1 capsular biosynthesis protein [Photobacterium iliopiscarium]